MLNLPAKKKEKGIMVAGGISKYGVGNLIFVLGTMNSFSYESTLEFYSEDMKIIKI